MKKVLSVILAVVIQSSYLSVFSGPGLTPQRKYADRFAPLAVAEMYRCGVPASITLAQGILESRAGQSELAVKGNNHFGIKCHNSWKGGKMYHDDDRKGECFRKYDSPEESYRDHSDFLRYRERYRFLFDYNVTDYKAWAYGLKKAGYATDPSYPGKLIRLIEEYDLHEYDRKPASFAGSVNESLRHGGNLPESPSQIEEVGSLSRGQIQEFRFSMSREVFTKNGVPFVYSVEGDTYESLAAAYSLFTGEILRFNDVKSSVPLAPGTVIYLQKKKKKAAKGLEKHVIEAGETMREISQRYAIRLSCLYKLNGMSEIDVPREGDIIRLRK